MGGPATITKCDSNPPCRGVRLFTIGCSENRATGPPSFCELRRFKRGPSPLASLRLGVFALNS